MAVSFNEIHIKHNFNVALHKFNGVYVDVGSKYAHLFKGDTHLTNKYAICEGLHRFYYAFVDVAVSFSEIHMLMLHYISLMVYMSKKVASMLISLTETHI